MDIVTNCLFKHKLSHGETLGPLLLQTGAVKLVQDMADSKLCCKINVLGKQNAEEKTPGTNVPRLAPRALRTVGKEVNDGRADQTSEPGQEAQSCKPRADRVSPPRDWSLAVDSNLHRVTTKLDPVVD